MAVEHEVETQSSILAFGWRGNQSVVLKVIRNHGDEWHSGDILDAFDGNGVVRVLDRFDGAVLLERLQPGDSLVGMAVNGNDDQATGILADVIGRMYPRAPDEPRSYRPGVGSRVRTLRSGRRRSNSEAASRCCATCVSPSCVRHKPNRGCSTATCITTTVLLDAERGWLAIDPKGIIGEPEYEVGAALRNPYRAARAVYRAGNNRA